MTKREEALALIKNTQTITFLTGAGVSVASGIPDYRSLDGVYQGHEAPEYLLSRSCLLAEPQKFYDFVKELYYPEAQPNSIHLTLVELAARNKKVTIVTQNIDQLHHQAGSRQVVSFHGSLYECYCMDCQQGVSVRDYLRSDRHANCGGQLRPNVVLYEEGLAREVIDAAVKAVATAALVVIVGTSFKVYPFASLIQYKRAGVPVIVVNKEMIELTEEHLFIQEDARSFFEKVSAKGK